MSQRPLVFIIIPIPTGLSRGRTTKASLCEGGGSAKRWRRERRHAVFSPPVGCADSPLTERALQRGSAVIPSQCSHWRGNPSFPLWGNGLPRQSVPQGHLLRGADWLAMTRCVGDGVPDVPHKTCRGERPCPPHATAAPCRAGPACPAGSNAYFAAGHMGPALRDLRLTYPTAVRKADTNCE